jgi:hypothetical protein
MASSVAVDTQGLGEEAGTLGGQVSALATARDEVGSAVANALGSCGTVNDDGLRGALSQLSEAWGFEIPAISSDIATAAGLMRGLASAYAQLDSQGAAALNA